MNVEPSSLGLESLVKAQSAFGRMRCAMALFGNFYPILDSCRLPPENHSFSRCLQVADSFSITLVAFLISVLWTSWPVHFR
jgi:hypothetical protein